MRASAFAILVASVVVTSPPTSYAAQAVRVTIDPARDYEPTWAPDGSRIAFSSNRNGNWDIWVIPAVGGAATQISDDPADDVAPEWSPDGSQIAFGSNRSGSWDIWVMPAGGGTATQISTNEQSYKDPTWSPDGTQIACLSGDLNVRVFPSTGGTGTQITYTNDVSAPAWSPVGRRIAYSRRQTLGRQDIWVVRAITDGPTWRLTSAKAWDLSPAWSPDGSQIAFHAYYVETFWDIWVVPATGGTPVQITNDPAVDQFPSWSPDGEHIAFTSLREGNHDIWVIPARTVAVQSESWSSIKEKYKE